MLTSHGVKRVEERIGISRKYYAEHIEHVLKTGRESVDFTPGSAFKKFLNRKLVAHPDKRLLIYGHYIYVFGNDNVLVTVLTVPPRFREFLRRLF